MTHSPTKDLGLLAIFAVIACMVSLSFVSPSFAFGPCTNTFPDGVSYLPSVPACRGKAAIAVYGKFIKTFSAVVRDCNNDDRDPCNKGPKSCGSNFSSPYKAQSIVNAKIQRAGSERIQSARLFCLKERGDSAIYKLVRRITIKLVDPVRKPSDVAKICLKTRTSAVRPLTILETGTPRSIASTGYSAVCKSQPYLACSVSYANICPSY